jgi:PKD repeat protein
VSSRSLISSAKAVGLISAVVAIAIILFAANITIINAQQLTNQLAVTQNGSRLFESTEDSFRLQVPRGWIIHDVNNTGPILSEESTQGYGILAQLCPQERQQQRVALPNAASNGSNTFSSCDQSENDIIHIVRYHDLDTRLQAANNDTTVSSNSIMTNDNILSYHLQKLQEVGYRSMQIVNSTDMTVNLTNPQTNQTIATVPARFVEMTYSTASAPNEIREGYFILTATNATAPNVGMTKGYSIFYEGNSAAATSEMTTTTTPSGSLAPTPLPAPVRQVFDSFELVTMVSTEPLTVEIISSDTEEGEGGGGGEDTVPATIEFEANVAGGTEPYSYSWDFDDDGGGGGGESTEQSVSHTFEEAGSYDVGLTVTDSSGQSASDSMEITVEEEEIVEEEEEEVPLAAEEVEEEVEEEEEEEEIIEEEIIEEQQPLAAEEVEEEEIVEEEEQQQPLAAEEVEEDNNSGSDDLIDVDDVFDVDKFIDDLFDRFGLDN